MQFLSDLVHNPVFLSAAASWFIAQSLKMILDVFRGSFTPGRLAGGGGMPSAHSATVCGLATACGLQSGGRSSEFVIALFLAIIVIYDAMGVRYVTGQQAGILNRMRRRDQVEGRKIVQERDLEENMGHTLPEIAVGGVLGITAAVVVTVGIL